MKKLISYRYWLFGEKEQREVGGARSKRVRGWFPQPCAIEVIESNVYGIEKLSKDD